MYYVLDSTSNKIVKYLRTQRDYAYNFSMHASNVIEAMPSGEFFICCDYLVSVGACKYVDENQKHIGIQLTHLAVHHREMVVRRVLSIVFTSVLLPIIVTILTTLVMTGLKPKSIQNQNGNDAGYYREYETE